MKLPGNNFAMLRLVISAYLVYLGVSIIKSTISDNGNPAMIAAGVLFIAVGIFYAFFSFRTAKKMELEESEEPDAGEEDPAAETAEAGEIEDTQEAKAGDSGEDEGTE